MTRKKIWILISSICLSLVLAALLLPACAPATPEEAAEEIAALEAEIADLADELAAEKAKASDLEKEVAALKKPVEVQNWEPSSWLSAGIGWDSVVYMADYITRMSDGRIVVTPSAPGAIGNDDMAGIFSWENPCHRSPCGQRSYSTNDRGGALPI